MKTLIQKPERNSQLRQLRYISAIQFVNNNEYRKYHMNNGMLTGAVYVDLPRAFDTIGHSVLLQKLSTYGVKDKELKWFNSYLFNRKNYVYVDRNISSLEPAYCGVPRGSILRPSLFIIFINDLSNYIEHASVIMYAEDTELYTSHESKEKIENDLNKDMQNLLSYFGKNEPI